MTEDSRRSRNPAEPDKRDPAGAERWADYLEWLREDIIAGVLGLSAADRRASRLPSSWSPIELLSHLLHMEQRWFVWGFLGEPVAEPWGDWNVEDPSLDPSPEGVTPAWTVAADLTAEDIAVRLRAVGQHTRRILGEHSLDERAQVGGRFAEDPPTLEWICFHVLAEYARHAGHLDIVLELTSDAG